MLRHFPWCWAVWGSEAPHAQASQLSGPVGRMQSRWWARATQKFLLSWVRHLEGNPDPPSLAAAEHAARALTGFWASNLLLGVHCLFGARPAARAPDTFEPGTQRQGWQHEASSRTEESFRNVLFTGPGAGLALTTCPTCLVTRLEPQKFRVLLLRRLRLPLPSRLWRSCRCGQPLDSCGHHHAACAQAGVLGRRGWALESVVARVCREAGGPGHDQRDVARPRHGFA